MREVIVRNVLFMKELCLLWIRVVIFGKRAEC